MFKILIIFIAINSISCISKPPDIIIPNRPNPMKVQQGEQDEKEGDQKVIIPEKITVEMPEYKTDEENTENRKASAGSETELVSYKNVELEIKPKTEYYKGGAVQYPYIKNRVYQIFTSVDKLTSIQLEPGENLVAPPVSGNTEVFEVVYSYSYDNGKQRASIYVMPWEANKSTTLFLNTDKRTYAFMLYSYQRTFMPLVTFSYPLEMQQAIQKKAQEMNTDIVISGYITDLDFNYEIIPHSPHKPRWMPTHVFTDGIKTYINFPSASRASYAPVLFEIKSGERVIVNYRVKNTYYIVDRVLNHAELVLDINEGNIITVKKRDE
jgi:type IV secretion system protein VirB9